MSNKNQINELSAMAKSALLNNQNSSSNAQPDLNASLRSMNQVKDVQKVPSEQLTELITASESI